MSSRHDRLTFFIDRDLGRTFFEVLGGDTRFESKRHDDLFAQNTSDPDWIVPVTDWGWIGVTHDKAISRDHYPDILRAGARILVVVGKIEGAADNFRDTFPKIARFIELNRAPFVARVYRPNEREAKRLRPKGSIKLWKPGG